MTVSADLLLRFGVALAIGFMIGLQREYAFLEKQQTPLAGERTFALMALVGSLAAMIADIFDSSLAFLGIIFLAGIFYCSRIFYSLCTLVALRLSGRHSQRINAQQNHCDGLLINNCLYRHLNNRIQAH